MSRGLNSGRFQHLVFPKLERMRLAVNLAPQELGFPAEESLSATWHPDERQFVSWLLAQGGICADQYRPETLQRRLAACLRTLRASSVAHAREYLQQFPEATATAISSILIGVTSFFRDPQVFEELKRQLARDIGLGKRAFRVWSIGCSDGAELYSVAMMLSEMKSIESSYLLGTDCRPDAIATARDGIYDDSSIRSIPAEFQEAFVERHDNRQRICSAIRSQVTWRISNVLNEMESGTWDVILFRNAGLYFRPEFVIPLWAKLETLLRPGGILILGRAERPLGTQRLRPIGSCIYRRA